MASIMTLDGALRATDEYGEQIPVVDPMWGEAAKTFFSWGVLAFAVGSAAHHLRKRFLVPAAAKARGLLKGARPQRRRRRRRFR